MPYNISADLQCTPPSPQWTYWYVTGAVLNALGIILGLFGSALVVIAVTTRRELKQAKNAIVVFLTIPDVFMLAVLYSANVDAYIHRQWRYGRIACKVWPILAALCVASSMLLQATIAVQKYAVFFYKKKILYSKRSILVALFLSWLIPILAAIPDLRRVAIETPDNTSSCFRCIYYSEISDFTKWSVAVAFVLTPCLISAICYTSIVLQVRDSRRVENGSVPVAFTSYNRDWKRRELELVKMFATSLFVMVIGYTPFTVLQVFDDQSLSIIYYLLFATLHCFVTSSNVWLYGLMHKDFRAAYIDVFRRITCRRRPSSTCGNLRNGSNGSNRLMYRYCGEGCCPHEFCAFHTMCYPHITCSYGCPDGECHKGICMPQSPCLGDTKCPMAHHCTYNYSLGYKTCQYNLDIGLTTCVDSEGHPLIQPKS